MRKYFLSLLFVTVLAFSQALFSQDSVPVLKAVKVEQPPVINGIINDPSWGLAESFSGFTMVEPVAGSEPSEQTEVKIIYDEKNLYIAVHCFDSEPKRVAGNTMVHDELGGFHGPEEDMISLLLDPFQDKRNAYIFMVNPRGARSEGFASGEHASLSWDGIWNARSRVGPDGWTTEIMIPFKTLSFNPKLDSWGINIERLISRKQEKVRISGLTLDSYFTNPNEASVLTGISGARQGSGTTVRPYALASFLKDHADPANSKNKPDAGVDLYQNITPNLVASVSLNTDFAETEVDEQRVNLTRFPLFYPEKRTFFLEGSDIFDFGPSGTSRSFMPFFSRRIGLDKGEPVPILLGAKMYGKIGNTNISMLDVQTSKTGELSSTNMFAGRISQNILEESRVGVIFTNGSQSGQQNSLVGADFVYKTSRLFDNYNFSAGAWGVYNFNQAESGHKEAYGIKLDFPNDFFDAVAIYNYFGDSINPGLGFLPRNANKRFWGSLQIKPRPEKGLIGDFVRQFTFSLRPAFYWNLTGELESSLIALSPFGMRTESGENLEFKVNFNHENLPEDFNVSEGAVIPVGDYSYINYSLEAGSSTHRRIYVKATLNAGDFYNGTYDETKIEAAVRYNGYITIGGGGTVVHGYLPQANFTENLLNLKANLFITPDLGITNYFEFDDTSDYFAYNGRFFWQIRPGNTIYLVYNSARLRQWNPESRFVPQQDRISVKIQLTLR